MAYGVWCVVHEYDAWCMVYGVWCTVPANEVSVVGLESLPSAL
jgi:hypothetical protein